MSKKRMFRFCDICEMLKPANIYMPKGSFGHAYIQEFKYDPELDIYIKSQRIKLNTLKVSSSTLYNLRIQAQQQIGMLR